MYITKRFFSDKSPLKIFSLKFSIRKEQNTDLIEFYNTEMNKLIKTKEESQQIIYGGKITSTSKNDIDNIDKFEFLFKSENEVVPYDFIKKVILRVNF